jgi:hypothetical protein
MENTNCGENCAYVKSGFCKSDCECPYYVQTWWTNDVDPQPKLVKDCFPKKFAVEQNQVVHRVIVLQSVIEELRNRVTSLENLIRQLIIQNNALCVQNEILVKSSALEHQKNKEIGVIE